MTNGPAKSRSDGRKIPTGRDPRMLVVKLSSLGDLLHALPALQTLHRQAGWTFDWVVKERYAELVRLFAPVREAIPFPEHISRRTLAGFLRKLRRRYYPVILDMQGLLRSALIARAARGGVRIGPSFQREGAAVLYHEIAGVRNKQRHAVEELMDFVRHLGLRPGEYEFPLRIPDLPPPAAPRPQIVIAPGSRWPTKNWPWRNFVPVAVHLIDSLHATVVLAGGRRDRALCENIAREVRRPGSVFNRAGETDLEELVVLCHAADLVLSVDSGPMHLAAALGKPVVALFGPTDPVRTGPFGRGHRVLTAEIHCRPCFDRRCRYGKIPPPCMSAISPEEVTHACVSALRSRT